MNKFQLMEALLEQAPDLAPDVAKLMDSHEALLLREISPTPAGLHVSLNERDLDRLKSVAKAHYASLDFVAVMLIQRGLNSHERRKNEQQERLEAMKPELMKLQRLGLPDPWWQKILNWFSGWTGGTT